MSAMQLHKMKRLHACSIRRNTSLRILYHYKRRKRREIIRWRHIGKVKRVGNFKPNPNRPQWGELPELAVITILSYLNKSDRTKMALMCRRWAELFHEPILWKKACVDFCSHRITNAELQCLYRHTNHIKSLEIVLWKNFGFNNKLSLKYVPQLISVLSSSELHDLHLRCLRVGAHGRNWPTASLTVSAIANFLANQRRLKDVKLSNLRVDEKEGLSILSSMANHNQLRISTLDIRCLLQKGAKMGTNFVDVFGHFVNLREIHLNYSYISDELIEKLTSTCAKSLRTMCVDAHHNEPHRHIIKSSSWRRFKKACPTVQVRFSIEYISSHSELRVILSPGIPLRTLNMWTGYDVDDDVGLPHLLVDLGLNYRDHLEDACIQIDNREAVLDHELLFFVNRCKKLVSLDLTASLVNLEVVKQVCALREENKIVLDRFHLSLFESFDDDNLELGSGLEELREHCKNMITKTGADFQFKRM